MIKIVNYNGRIIRVINTNDIWRIQGSDNGDIQVIFHGDLMEEFNRSHHIEF